MGEFLVWTHNIAQVSLDRRAIRDRDELGWQDY